MRQTTNGSDRRANDVVMPERDEEDEEAVTATVIDDEDEESEGKEDSGTPPLCMIWLTRCGR